MYVTMLLLSVGDFLRLRIDNRKRYRIFPSNKEWHKKYSQSRDSRIDLRQFMCIA